MAKKTSADKRADWQTDFVQCALTKEMKDELATFDVDGSGAFTFLTGAINDGYKFSASLDKAHDCIGTYLTEGKGVGDNRKRCLSARGSDLTRSLRALYYKHAVVLEGDWGTAREPDDNTDSFG